MYRYRPLPGNDLLPRGSCGILCEEEREGEWVPAAVIAAFSRDPEAVSRLAERCTRLRLSPEQVLEEAAALAAREDPPLR